MTGTVKQMITMIVSQRSKGNEAIAKAIETKLILKGIDPEAYSASSPDDPAVIAKLHDFAKQLGVKLQPA